VSSYTSELTGPQFQLAVEDPGFALFVRGLFQVGRNADMALAQKCFAFVLRDFPGIQNPARARSFERGTRAMLVAAK